MDAIKAVTFDYFGTLVDVDAGGTAGMAQVLSRLGRDDLDAAAFYLDWDVRTVQLYRSSAYRRYREVAAEALAATLAGGGIERLDAAQLPALTDTLLTGLVEQAPPHPEVPEILALLAAKYPLMPITNMDSDLFARSRLASFFPSVTTAEMARAYKPSERIFRLALERLALAPAEVLHASLASWADIDGAKPLGMRVAWINRTQDRLGPWQPRPDHEFADLSGLREVLAL
ncbi:HAD hydrolase-like protein [Azospirillum sp. B21]|uniref:HAD family hydrolase n=1 Tax=Azospirillum sp. B21 TaxID=2607496 RepID=UPI0011EC8A56|nr:HAD family hydrolase [Azospirillum sp. B21]KAA0575193.1 HAD hydrolase-like protein [Azospirillum sp. B21]